MKKTGDDRCQWAFAFHETTIDEVACLLSVLSDEFFSKVPDSMSESERTILKNKLLYNYQTIATILNLAISLLSDINTDMDAAQGIKTDAVLIRKKYLCKIYGLTEDTDAPLAGEHSDRAQLTITPSACANRQTERPPPAGTGGGFVLFLVEDFGSFWKFRGDPGGCDSALPLSIKHKFFQVLRSGVAFFMCNFCPILSTRPPPSLFFVPLFSGFLLLARPAGPFFILGISRHFWTFVRLGPVQTQVFTGFLVGRREKGTATPHRLVMHRRASGKVSNAPSKHFWKN